MNELDEARQLVNRYRSALNEIVQQEGKCCEDYAMCDHVACMSSARSWHIAVAALRLAD